MGRLLRRMLAVLFVMVVLLGGALGWLSWQVGQETVTPLATLNETGEAGRALTVLSPGMSPFPERVMTAFNAGLAESDWRIDHTTASAEATVAFGEYDLIVLVSPIYGSQVAPPLLNYVDRVGDFGGKPVVAVVTAGGDPKESLANTQKLIADHGGAVAGLFGYAVWEPNDPENRYEGSNTDRAVAMAHDAAATLAGELR